MATCATLVSMAHYKKVENLRAFMVNSRGFQLPQTKLFEQKFLDLCSSRTPDHPTYSAMIFMAITDLNEEGGSSEEAISEFIKSKYKNLPFAHTSLLSHHLGKLVEKTEILYDYNNYCYALPGEKDKTAASTDVERKSLVIRIRANDERVANEVITSQNEEENVRIFESGNHNVDLLEERSLIVSGTSPTRKACDGINALVVRHTENNGVKYSTVEDNRVAEEVKVALEISETEGRIQANSEGGESYEVVVPDAQDDVLLMEESGKEEGNPMAIISKHRTAKWRRTSNRMKEACVEVKSEAYKRLWECQTDACDNIIALEKMLKQCREKDQKNKAVSEDDEVSRLPLSMESCKELWKVAHKIQNQLSEIIDSCDDAEVPYYESRGCENKSINKEFLKEGSKKRKASRGRSGSKKKKEKETDSLKKSQLKKTRIRRLQDI